MPSYTEVPYPKDDELDPKAVAEAFEGLADYYLTQTVASLHMQQMDDEIAPAVLIAWSNLVIALKNHQFNITHTVDAAKAFSINRETTPEERMESARSVVKSKMYSERVVEWKRANPGKE